MFNNAVIVIVEVNEPNKAPDLRYVSYATSDVVLPDKMASNSALGTFKESKDYPNGTEFKVNKILRFNNLDEYYKFLSVQVSDYLETLK